MELKDYISVLYNRKWIVVETAVLVLAVALIFTFLQAPSYQSRVKILSEVSSASESVLGSFFTSALFDPDRYLKTQTEIIQTETMAQAVEEHLRYMYDQSAREREAGKEVYIPERIPTALELSKMVEVEQEERTNIFDIIVTADDPLLSRDVAQAYADEYIASRQLAAIRQISEARKEVWNRIKEVEDQIEELSEEAKQYTAGNLPAELQAEAQRVVSLWASLYEKYMTLRIAESLEQRGLEIIEPAKEGLKVGPRPTRNGVLALFLGLLLGIGLAFLVDYLDDTLKTREEFEKYFQAPIVGEIPQVPEEEYRGYDIIYFDDPRHPAAEGYRTLRTNLEFLNMEGKTKVILVTSAGPGEGKSTVMVNLGAALSEMGKKVLLVEADLRKPILNRFFGLSEGDGLSSVLTGGHKLEEAVHKTSHPNLEVLPAGVKPPNPAEMVASGAMRRLLEEAREKADYVLVDSPPLLATSDSMALAPLVDGVLLVASYGLADREGARRTVDIMGKMEARVLGVVINNIAPARRYGYYHYYYSPYYMAEEERVERRRFLDRFRKKAPRKSLSGRGEGNGGDSGGEAAG
jgi:capsular exopolysaccharide synthesis family protein